MRSTNSRNYVGASKRRSKLFLSGAERNSPMYHILGTPTHTTHTPELLRWSQRGPRCSSPAPRQRPLLPFFSCPFFASKRCCGREKHEYQKYKPWDHRHTQRPFQMWIQLLLQGVCSCLFRAPTLPLFREGLLRVWRFLRSRRPHDQLQARKPHLLPTSLNSEGQYRGRTGLSCYQSLLVLILPVTTVLRFQASRKELPSSLKAAFLVEKHAGETKPPISANRHLRGNSIACQKKCCMYVNGRTLLRLLLSVPNPLCCC